MKRRIPFINILVVCVLIMAATLIYLDFIKPVKDSGNKKVLEIMYFYGGYGVEFLQECSRRFEMVHPDVKVDIWASPRVSEKIRLRLLSGDPPDIIQPSIGLDMNRVIEAGLLYNLQPALDGKSFRGTERWEDDFYPGIFEQFRFGRKTFGLPFYYTTTVFWYNHGMFEKNGWGPPQTWQEFERLCANIKEAGIAPIALQGRYIGYLVSIFQTMLDRMQEPGFVEAASQLEPGKWSDPAVVACAQRIQDFFQKGYFQDGCLGMSHTESQMEFFQGRAAMVWCGTWLVSEMKSVIPSNFSSACFTMPMIEGGKGDPTRMEVMTDYFYVCEQAKNRDLAIAFLKFMCDPQIASIFVNQYEALTGIKDANDNPKKSLKSVSELLKKAKSFRAPTAHGNPYPSWDRTVMSCMSELVTRHPGSNAFEITPQQFADKLERFAGDFRKEKAVRDSSIQTVQ